MNRKSKKIADLTAIHPEDSDQSEEEEEDEELCDEIEHLCMGDLLQKYKVEEAVKKGDYETVALLLKQGARITESGDILQHAIKSGNADIVEILLKYGADANGIIMGDETSRMIHLAASSMQPEAIKILIKYGADVNDNRSRFSRTPIFWAFISPELDAACPWVERCVSENMVLCSIRQPDECGETGKFKRLYDTVNTLLECGADVNAIDKTGKVALQFCTSDYYSCRPLLFHKTANIIIKYIALAKFVTCYIARKNVEVITQPFSTFLRDAYEASLLEITAMKSIHISNTITFYDVLTRDTKYLAKIVRHRDVMATFQSDVYVHEFHLYADFLKRQYEKGCVRRDLIEASIRSFSYFMNHKLPDDIIEKIFNELHESDLVNILDAYQGM